MTIKEMAEKLNLSISTVSKAITGAFDVSDETRKTVLEYAKEVGYKTKDERKITKHRRRVCILFDNMNPTNQANVFYPLATSFSNEATQSNCEVIIDSLSQKDKNFNFNNYMEENKFDGAFIIGINFNSVLFNQLGDSKFPVVLYDNNFIGDKVATISIDNLSSISNMVNFLYEKGHRKIGFLNGEKQSFVSNERLAGYIIGLSKNNIEYNPNFVAYGDYSKQSGEQLANYFINKGLTAIVCSSDLMAIGLMDGLRAKGINIPDEISVTGFDDLEFAEHVRPSLTTIKQDLTKMGQTGFELLATLFMNKTPQRITLKGNIIVRDSVIDVNK